MCISIKELHFIFSNRKFEIYLGAQTLKHI